jgi:hypothetical protein
MRSDGHIIQISDTRKVYQILFGKTAVKRMLLERRRKYEEYTEIKVREMELEKLYIIHDRVKFIAFVNTVLKFRVS